MFIMWLEVCQNGGHTNSFKNLLQTHQSECFQIWVPTLGQGTDVKLRRSCRSHDRKCVKMAVVQIPSKIFSKPTNQNATEFGLQYQVSVGMLNWATHADCVTESVSKWPTIDCLENHVNSFNNLLLQAHQSECNKIWFTKLQLTSFWGWQNERQLTYHSRCAPAVNARPP